MTHDKTFGAFGTKCTGLHQRAARGLVNQVTLEINSTRHLHTSSSRGFATTPEAVLDAYRWRSISSHASNQILIGYKNQIALGNHAYLIDEIQDSKSYYCGCRKVKVEIITNKC